MVKRSADAWEPKDIIVQAANVYYIAPAFYLQEQPTLLTELLAALMHGSYPYNTYVHDCFTLKIAGFHSSCRYSSLIGQFTGI
jgi:hypothetical protein